MGEIRYANSIEIETQLFDAQLKFSLESNDEVVDTTTIILSPQHLKVLSYVTAAAVKKYESEIGTINLPTKQGVKIEDASKNKEE